VLGASWYKSNKISRSIRHCSERWDTPAHETLAYSMLIREATPSLKMRGRWFDLDPRFVALVFLKGTTAHQTVDMKRYRK